MVWITLCFAIVVGNASEPTLWVAGVITTAMDNDDTTGQSEPCAQESVDDEIDRIKDEFRARRYSGFVTNVRYKVSGSWIAEKGKFRRNAKELFPPKDVRKDYSAEVFLDVATRQYQLRKNSFTFYAERKIVPDDCFVEWDGEQSLVHHQNVWEEKRRREVHRGQPDIYIFAPGKLGFYCESLPYFFAHGHAISAYSHEDTDDFLDSLMFDSEERVDGHDCIVLRSKPSADGARGLKLWFARDLDYSIVQYHDIDLAYHLVIKYEMKSMQRVLKSFRIDHWDGQSVVEATVTEVELNVVDSESIKLKPDFEQGMLVKDEVQREFLIVTADKTFVPYSVVRLFSRWFK